VKGHWDKVVKHNGWLLKRGGTTKSWLKVLTDVPFSGGDLTRCVVAQRYFVLFETSQGHFLNYYAEYWDSPLYK
jgi:hypothetical protein